MLQGLTGTHLIVIVFIIVLLFGAPKLPALAKSIGQSMKILKKEVAGDDDPKPAAKSEDSVEASK